MGSPACRPPDEGEPDGADHRIHNGRIPCPQRGADAARLPVGKELLLVCGGQQIPHLREGGGQRLEMGEVCTDEMGRREGEEGRRRAEFTPNYPPSLLWLPSSLPLPAFLHL